MRREWQTTSNHPLTDQTRDLTYQSAPDILGARAELCRARSWSLFRPYEKEPARSVHEHWDSSYCKKLFLSP